MPYAHLSKPRLGHFERRSPGVYQTPIKLPVLQENGEGTLTTIQNSAISEVQKYSKLLNVVQLVASGHLGKG